MFRRRRRDAARDEEVTATPAEPPDVEPEDDAAGPAEAEEAPEPQPSPKSDRPAGPWDAGEVDLGDGPGPGRVDLGGLLVPRPEGGSLQVQVEERTGRASSVMLVLPDGAVQLLAVAAPRSSGMWGETRPQIAADAVRRGGSATEADGPLGTEMRVVVPATLPDGSKGVQPSRVVGIDGPRWMLRATFLGRAVNDAAVFSRLATLVRDVVVVRGDQPMPPGDLIPLRVPEGAVPTTPRPRPPAPADPSPGT